jgi:hypothetical protein
MIAPTGSNALDPEILPDLAEQVLFSQHTDLCLYRYPATVELDEVVRLAPTVALSITLTLLQQWASNVLDLSQQVVCKVGAQLFLISETNIGGAGHPAPILCCDLIEAEVSADGPPEIWW